MNWIYLGIALGIFLLGLIFFIFLASRKKYRDATAAPNYERIRNKVTVRQPQIKASNYSESEFSLINLPLGNIIGGFIAILVGVSLLPTITSEINNASMSANVTGASSTLMNITPLFFILCIVAIALSIVGMAFKRSGML